MAFLTGRFVGRADELRSLGRILDELDGGHARVVELVGEPGIGKTSLLAELAARADARGHLVLTGSASEFERDLPFSVFVDALDEHLRGLHPERLLRLSEDVRTELAHVFPGLAGHATGGDVALQHERYRSHRAVRALLEHLAETRPVVLVLDDLHWADPASVELFGALLRRPPTSRVLIAVAFRPRLLSERLALALGQPHVGELRVRMELGALTVQEAREFLGGTVSPAEAAILHEDSGGNPLYLNQLARSLDDSGGQPRVESSLADTGVPSAVVASLRAELSLLSDGARLVLEGAAVAGDPFEPELAATAAGTSEVAAMDAIDELLRFDLIRGTDVPRRFRFRHPIIRRAVYEATSGGWRLGAHERCAKVLSAWGATPAARAHHVERSAREGDTDAVAVLREAGEAAARLAPASAARWFADALRLLPGTAPAEERVGLLLARADALTAAGHVTDSREALVEALQIVPRDAHAMRARVTRACAGVESVLGEHEQARDHLVGALADMPDSGAREAVPLMIELAMNGFWRASYAEMHGPAEEALKAARAIGDMPMTAGALSVLALGDSMMKRADRAAGELSEAADIVDSLPDEELTRGLSAPTWLAGAELYLDRFEEADRHATRALALARASEHGELFLVLVQILGRVWFVRGKLTQAGEILDDGVEAARLLGNTQVLVWNLFNRSVVALAMGDVQTARATAQESVDLSEELGPGFHTAWAGVRLAAVHLATGRPDLGAELLLRCAGGEELTRIAGSWRSYCLELLTRCWLALGRPADAERAAGLAQDWAAAVELPLATAWADRAAAAVSLFSNHPARAAQQALGSAASADEAGAPIEAALSRTLAGRALAKAGDTERGAAELTRAAAYFDACGALRHRDEAERELQKLGHHVPRRTRPGRTAGGGVTALTERELQVARLVVDRRTNHEIAAELYISQKTVETHLRNIFHKMGVTTRVALARAVERAERTPSP